MTQARTKDYWISPSALHIELNALGNPDYIQASCMSGAQILVYVKDIIGFDAGHNYRRWPLQAAPTVFNTHTEKYVYAAIPRDMTLAASAWIVFPSEQIDIYGKNEKEEQIGDENYYYIFLQGIITSSGDNGTVQRDWKEGGRIVYGYLSSDEAISAIPYESEWYNYSSVDNIVTFLKDITMKVGTKFRQLFAKTLTIVSGGKIAFEDQGEVNGVATTDTQLESTDKIVTPKFLDDNALSKVKQDAAQEIIRFIKGLTLGENTGGNNFGISSDGIATLKEVVSAAFRSGALGSGFKLGNYSDSEDSYLEVDHLLVRKAAEFVKLVIRELQSVGGEIVLSPASMKVSNVESIPKGSTSSGYESGAPYEMTRCYFLQKVGDREIANQFVKNDLVRCQTFNIKTGTSESARNRYYWRRVHAVGSDYIDVVNNSGEGTDQPAAGDELVQMGNTTDVARQSVLYLSAYGEDSPSIKLYKGVNDYTLDGREVFCLSPNGTRITSTSFEWISSSGQTVHMVNYRGEWQRGTTYDYYDQVNHNNAVWLCTNESGTAAEPMNGSADWLKQIEGEKGEKGDPGEDGLAYQIVITSSSGTVMINGTGQLTLEAKLLRNGEDISDTISNSAWSWRRQSADTADDATWNTLHEGIGRVCVVSSDDVVRQAQFECEVLI